MLGGDCPFCEARGIDDWRLVAETEGHYVFPTYGMLGVEGYLVIAPKDHVPCYGAWGDEGGRAEHHGLVGRARSAVRELYGKEALVLEHGVTGQTVGHAHTHVVPGLGFEPYVAELQRTLPEGTQYVLKERPSAAERDGLRELGHARGGYLYVEGEDAAAVFFAEPADEHRQVLRKVAARLLGDEGLADWRKVRDDPVLRERDLELIRATTEDMRPYFEGLDVRGPGGAGHSA